MRDVRNTRISWIRRDSGVKFSASGLHYTVPSYQIQTNSSMAEGLMAVLLYPSVERHGERFLTLAAGELIDGRKRRGKYGGGRGDLSDGLLCRGR